jgi:hypothetical protein
LYLWSVIDFTAVHPTTFALNVQTPGDIRNDNDDGLTRINLGAPGNGGDTTALLVNRSASFVAGQPAFVTLTAKNIGIGTIARNGLRLDLGIQPDGTSSGTLDRGRSICTMRWCASRCGSSDVPSSDGA